MGCCGKARANLGVSRAAIAPASAPAGGARHQLRTIPNLPVNQGASPLQLRYAGAAAIVVRGPATGRSYNFSQVEPVRAVDPRDALVLLGTRYFRQA